MSSNSYDDQEEYDDEEEMEDSVPSQLDSEVSDEG